MMVGRYILNMGGIEAATRVLISRLVGTDDAPVMSADLPSRLGYLRSRFPLEPKERHSSAMNVFRVATKHVTFRNIVAHSPLLITGHADGARRIQGILNITPNDEHKSGELVSLEELRARVDESATVARELLKMQDVFASVAVSDASASSSGTGGAAGAAQPAVAEDGASRRR